MMHVVRVRPREMELSPDVKSQFIRAGYGRAGASRMQLGSHKARIIKRFYGRTSCVRLTSRGRGGDKGSLLAGLSAGDCASRKVGGKIGAP